MAADAAYFGGVAILGVWILAIICLTYEYWCGINVESMESISYDTIPVSNSNRRQSMKNLSSTKLIESNRDKINPLDLKIVYDSNNTSDSSDIRMFSLIFFVGLLLPLLTTGTRIKTLSGVLDYQEDWNYVNVRPNAYMFWWLYHVSPTPVAPNPNRPLILWLQGGPGASGTGFGNFDELGPMDVNGNPRNTTWLQKADLLFVDNPVGTGFSYVTDNSAYTTDVAGIATDLVTMMKSFLETHPQYQTKPFYIFCESYGGKMAAEFAWYLFQAQQAGSVKVNLQGVSIGDGWVSPIDFVNSWGNYLYYFSYLSDTDLATYKTQAQHVTDLVNQGRWSEATDAWGATESLVGRIADDVSWYNVLKRGNSDALSSMSLMHINSLAQQKTSKNVVRLFQNHMSKYFQDPLPRYMNGPVKKKLGIIPNNVSWGGQAGNVFSKQSGDFMKDNVATVDNLLANTNMKVTIYNGQLDLICDTIGVEMWMKKLHWPNLSAWRQSNRIPFYAGPMPVNAQTAGFYKKYKKLAFFWIMRAGHMVPADAPYASLRMIDLITQW